jgi:hypothetical protein
LTRERLAQMAERTRLLTIRLGAQAAAQRGAKYMESDDKCGQQKGKRRNAMKRNQSGEQEANGSYKREQMPQTEAKQRRS